MEKPQDCVYDLLFDGFSEGMTHSSYTCYYTYYILTHYKHEDNKNFIYASALKSRQFPEFMAVTR